MKKLFLASWFAGSASLLPAFVKEDLTGKKVVFIPTASSYEMADEDRAGYDYINGLDKEALEKLGFIVESLDVINETIEKIGESIAKADCIFVCGGDTFFLLQELKRKGVDKMIAQHIEQGKLYMGTSAGSAIVQKDIFVDHSEDDSRAPELNGDFSALGFVDFYLHVHYGRNYFGDDEKVHNKYYAHLNCIKIDDNQAVTIDGNKMEIIAAPKSCIPEIPML